MATNSSVLHNIHAFALGGDPSSYSIIRIAELVLVSQHRL